ncbi:hypothetical protein OAF27_00810 [Verrucomicrobiales bacterium]|nr:hypothetical protein [Verrucomicrobiales bacterium]
MKDKSKAHKPLIKAIVPIGIGLIYALITRLLFNLEPLSAHLAIVSWSFIVVMPFAFGGITTLIGIRLCGRSHFWIYTAPIVSILLGFAVSFILNLEALLCIIVAAPIMMVSAMLGGMTCNALLIKFDSKLQLNLLVLLPFASSQLERVWEQPHELVTINDSIVIESDAHTIWEQIASVPAIGEDELPFQFIYLLDFPKPISAVIDYKGVGGERKAIFERNVTFYEKVTEWEEDKTLSFTIHADPEFIPRSAFDQHIIVGGRFYDVLNGTYRIESHETHCVLHLSSTHRISSPFNAYAGFWSEWVMNQIQGSILVVIKARCEKEA